MLRSVTGRMRFEHGGPAFKLEVGSDLRTLIHLACPGYVLGNAGKIHPTPDVNLYLDTIYNIWPRSYLNLRVTKGESLVSKVAMYTYSLMIQLIIQHGHTAWGYVVA